MTEIKIYQDNRRLVIMLILFFVGIFISNYFTYQRLNLVKAENINLLNILVILINLLVSIGFIFMIIKLLIKIIRKTPFLLFSEEKIVSSGVISTMEIYWDEVDYYTYKEFKGILFIVLKLSGDSSFKNKYFYFRRKLNNYNLERVGGEIAFSSIFLMDNFEEVCNFINSKVRKN